MSEATAELIAGDLALAIHQGLIHPNEQLPSQSKLMKSYGVATSTASSALTKLAAAGLVRSVPGKGTFAEDTMTLFDRHPVLDVMAASSVCRTLAAMHFGRSAERPTLGVGGKRGWDDPHADPEKTIPPQQVDMTALAGLDRHLLRWMSEAFLAAARRMVSKGQQDADAHLIEAARSILRDGGRRPEGQPCIAVSGGARPDEEDIVKRIWPERLAPRDPDGPPF